MNEEDGIIDDNTEIDDSNNNTNNIEPENDSVNNDLENSSNEGT